MPLLPVIGVLFIALKLMGYILWSWWLVLLPLYGAALLVVLLVLVTAFGLGGYGHYKRKRSRWLR